VLVFRLRPSRALQGPQIRLPLFQKLLPACLSHTSRCLFRYTRSLVGVMVTTTEPVEDFGFGFLNGHRFRLPLAFFLQFS
jgi:hypothetical protein